MCCLDTFKIDLKALEDAAESRNFHLTDDYFEAIDATEVRRGELDVQLAIRKQAGGYELTFDTTGHVVIPCDLCLDDMQQPISAHQRIYVKIGDPTVESDDADVMTVSDDDATVDTAWMIYESIVLAIPIKHVHETGKCNEAMTKKLNELSAARSSEGEDRKTTDPRWDALLKLKQE